MSLALVLSFLGSPTIAQEMESAPDPVQALIEAAEPLALNIDGSEGNAGIFLGVSQFPFLGGLNRLNFAAKDAIDTAYTFVLLGIIPPTNCYLLISSRELDDPTLLVPRGHPNPSLQRLAKLTESGVTIRSATIGNIEAALEVLAAPRTTTTNGLALIYIASHGEISPGRAYFASERGKIRPRGGLMDLETVNDHLLYATASKKLLIVDACRARRSIRGSGVGGDGEVENTPTPDLAEAVEQHLGGHATLLSCKDGQNSYEDRYLNGGVFTYFLLDALSGGVTSGTNEFLTLGEVAKRLSIKVEHHVFRREGVHQIPWLQDPTGYIESLPIAYTKYGLQVRGLRRDIASKLQRWKMALSPTALSYLEGTFPILHGNNSQLVLTDLTQRLDLPVNAQNAKVIEEWVSNKMRQSIIPPQINPSDKVQSVDIGHKVVLDVNVTGSEPLFVQWFTRTHPIDDWSAVLNATNKVLTLPEFTADRLGEYMLVATNEWGDRTHSGTITLKMHRRPLKIIEEPFVRSSKINKGESLVIPVTAVGGMADEPTRFRWQHRTATTPWRNIEANEDKLYIRAVDAMHTGFYRVRVFNSDDEVFSDEVFVQVILPLVWEEYFDAGLYSHEAACLEDPLTLIVKASGNEPLKYEWQFMGWNTSEWQVLATTNVFHNASLSEENGGKYRPVVTDSEGQSLVGNPLVLDIAEPMTAEWPASLQVPLCSEAFFTVEPSDAQADVRWLRKVGLKWETLSEADFSFSISSVSASDAGVYKVELENDCYILESPEFRLTVTERQMQALTMVSAPGRAFMRQGNIVYDVTNGGRMPVGQQVPTGFSGTVMQIAWAPFFGGGYSQVLPCGQVIAVQSFVGGQIGSFITTGQFSD